jgi:hypothetical protein
MKIRKPMTFKQAVEQTPDVANSYQSGLSALGQYATKVSYKDSRLLEGSVDIDTCTTFKYPNDNRWDYVLAYNQKVYFVEVHSANTSQVITVIRKLQWLKNWLNFNAPIINQLPKAQPAYYWIQSGSFAIPKNSPQYRKVIQNRIKPISLLLLV